MMRATLAVTALLLGLVAGCGGASDKPAAKPSPSKTEPATFDVRGTFVLEDAESVDEFYDDGSCSVNEDSGYDDLVEGAQVTVKDASGKALALGQLGGGRLLKSTGYCRFVFSVTDVPDEGNVYSIEITHRGDIQFTKDEAMSLALNIG